ncbi:MAG: hypothetical protein MJ091_07310, partial [Clostridia bacterium]|nr:hypothetical protein [Clostridia bacterium]
MRKSVNLNGKWDFCPLYNVVCDTSLNPARKYTKSITVPSSWVSNGVSYKEYTPYDIFGYPKAWNKADTAVYRRFFDVEYKENERVFLKIENVAQRAAVYCNEEFVCEWNEMYLPLFADITDFLKDNENKLEIVCTSFETVKIPSGKDKTVGLIGSWYGETVRGIWGNVSLHIMNSVHISDVCVRTSVRNKNIEIITECSENADNIEIVADIFDGDEKILSFLGGERIL